MSALSTRTSTFGSARSPPTRQSRSGVPLRFAWPASLGGNSYYWGRLPRRRACQQAGQPVPAERFATVASHSWPQTPHCHQAVRLDAVPSVYGSIASFRIR